MPTTFDVLVAGELNPDLILSDADLMPHFGQQETLVPDAVMTVGSSSAIFACAAARLGLRVGFIGVVGDDTFGRYMLDSLAHHCVDTSHVLIDPQQKTGFSVILNRGVDRAILTFVGAISALRAEHITEKLLSQARHLHIASYFLQTALRPDVAWLFQQAQQIGLTTSLDTNWDPSGEWVGIIDLLGSTTIFLPNAAEATAITGASEQEAADALARHGNIIAIKLGADGAIARRGSEIAQAAALPVQIADTVGAGDTFDAGFVYGFLQGWELERCLKLGAACGSLSTREFGGVNAQPTLTEALDAIKQYEERDERQSA